MELGRLTPATNAAGTLETPGDEDWFKVSLVAGADYVFTLDTRQAGHTLQSQGQLRLLDGRGAELAVANSGSATNTAQLVFHSTKTGDFYLAAGDPEQKHIGSYGVSMYGNSQDNLSADARTGATLTFRTADAPPRQDGGAGNDVFHGRNGDEVIDGKGGRDRVFFTGAAAQYALSQADGAIKVDALSGARGRDTLAGIERVIFDDLAIAYDTGGNAGKAYRLYQAAFERTPDLDGLGYWIAQLDSGASLTAVADAFIHSAEFVARYGAAMSDPDFVKGLYSNVLHRLPDQAGADFWNGALHGGTSRADILIAFSDSTENQAALIGQIAQGMTYHLYS